MNLISLLCLTIFLISCGMIPKKKIADIVGTKNSCGELVDIAKKNDIETRLNMLFPLLQNGCHKDVISFGAEIRAVNRDKYYSVTREAAEMIVYEGYAKDYVLESYERVFLSILMSMSYLQMNQKSEAQVELNKAYDESIAKIYNSGDDEINTFLQAILWSRLSGYEKAAPFFKKIEESEDYHPHLKIFAKNLEAQLRTGKPGQPIDIYMLNRMPKIHFNWFSSYREIYEPTLSVKNCISETGLILSTSDWIKEFKLRDHPEHDPVLSYKRTLRAPMVAIYTGLVLLTGNYVNVALAQSSTDGRRDGRIDLLTLLLAYETFAEGMAPDMRSWYELPQAFYFGTTKTSFEEDPCLRRYRSGEHVSRKLISL